MRFLVLTVGKCKYDFYQEALSHYREAIAPMAEIELEELRDQKSDLKKEADIMLAFLEKRRLLDGKNRIVLMDDKGKEFDSVALSRWIEKLEGEGISRIIFLVGGAYGFDERIRKLAQTSLSLSKMTFPHDLAKVVLLEQIYRALHIRAGGKYHHA